MLLTAPPTKVARGFRGVTTSLDSLALLARGFYARLAALPSPLAPAFAAVVSAIDSGALPPEIVADVVTGKQSLADALDAAAEVLHDSLADLEEVDKALRGEVDTRCAELSTAARRLRTMDWSY